jgi:hypothetical protein
VHQGQPQFVKVERECDRSFAVWVSSVPRPANPNKQGAFRPSQRLRFLNVGLTFFLGCSATIFFQLERSMRDLIFAICTIVFFAVSILYLRACERLK